MTDMRTLIFNAVQAQAGDHTRLIDACRFPAPARWWRDCFVLHFLCPPVFGRFFDLGF